MTIPHRLGSDLAERKILADINEFGWTAVNVVEDDGHPPWTFTIGLYETWQHPELIIVGRSRATAHEMLAAIAGEIEEHRPPDLTDPSPYLLLGTRCRFVNVAAHHYSDYVGFARWYYRGKHFPLYQIVWPSNDGHYPWNPKASEYFSAKHRRICDRRHFCPPHTGKFRELFLTCAQHATNLYTWQK